MSQETDHTAIGGFSRCRNMITETVDLQPFVNQWQDKPQEQVVEELASLSQETKRIPDAYLFEEDSDGDLYSPTARCKIRTIIRRDNPIGELEGQAFDKIGNWFKDGIEGAAVWISLYDPVYYSNPKMSKMIVSDIRWQDGRKILFNRAIMLDMNAQQGLELAKSLADCSLNRPLLTNVSEVRATAIFLRSHWKNIIQEFLDPEVWQMMESGFDIESKEKALETAQALYPVLMAGKLEATAVAVGSSGLIGAYDTSCPEIMGSSGQTAFEAFLGHSLVLERCKKIKCGKSSCGWEAQEGDIQKIKKGELTCCPDCGWKPGDPA